MDEDDGFEDAGTGTPLSAIAEAFEELSSCLKSNGYDDLRLKPFCDACSLVSVLFGCLGIAFKFAELEYVSKVSSSHFPSSKFSPIVCHISKRKKRMS